MKRIRISIAAAMLFLSLLPYPVRAAQSLIPGGQVIGLQLENETVTVAAFDDAIGGSAKQSGLQIGDVVLAINGIPVRCAEDVRNALHLADDPISVTVSRKGKQHSFSLMPQDTADGKKLGIYLKQGISGIGTVTWYDPQRRMFGTLGHGVNDGKGQLAPMSRGQAFHAQVVSVKKGVCGAPGQLKGSAENFTPWGTLLRNTHQGVFGTTAESFPGQAIPLAEYDQIRTGDASIRCSVENNRVLEYSVEIMKIYPRDRSDGRNFLLHVTDADLLAITGGIVQGMSGSPIIQDGKLVGAVTHVLVNDPTRGYGIFIENMLEAAD